MKMQQQYENFKIFKKISQCAYNKQLLCQTLSSKHPHYFAEDMYPFAEKNVFPHKNYFMLVIFVPFHGWHFSQSKTERMDAVVCVFSMVVEGIPS